MKPLLTVSAVLELGAGVALLALPALSVSILLGIALDARGGTTVARVAGAALVALGIACWSARSYDRSRAATGVAAGMLIYNVAVSAILAYAGFVQGLGGLPLWAAAVLHLAMAGWCLAHTAGGTRSGK